MIRRALHLILKNNTSTSIVLPDYPSDHEIGSISEMIDCLKKYKHGISRFRERNPNLDFVYKELNYESLDQAIHTVINSRKKIVCRHYLVAATYGIHYFDQIFKLDLVNNVITFFRVKTVSEVTHGIAVEEIGSMYLNSIFDNWPSVFHLIFDPLEISESEPELDEEDEYFEEGEHYEDEKDEDSEIDIDLEILKTDITTLTEKVKDLDDILILGDVNLNSSKMRTELVFSPELFKLWSFLYNNVYPNYVDNMHVTVEYSGSGDSGDIDSVSVYVKGVYCTEFPHNDHMHDKIWKVIDSRQSGFYNNEGGYGIIMLSPTKVKWDHYNYVNSTEHDVDLELDIEHYIKKTEDDKMPF